MSAGSDFTHVEFDALAQGEQDFLQTYSALSSELEQLQSQLATNLAEWSGAAQQAFTQAHQTWVAAMLNMQETIGDIAHVIGTANANYQQVEQSVASSWS